MVSPIERLNPGESIVLSLEVVAAESGPAGCHVSLTHAGMQPDKPAIEDDITTTVAKVASAEADSKK